MGYAPKAGTTTITVKTERETYKCTFTVYKYVNPVSSAKVGKLTIKGTAFKKMQFIICVIPNIKIRVSHLNLI